MNSSLSPWYDTPRTWISKRSKVNPAPGLKVVGDWLEDIGWVEAVVQVKLASDEQTNNATKGECCPLSKRGSQTLDSGWDRTREGDCIIWSIRRGNAREDGPRSFHVNFAQHIKNIVDMIEETGNPFMKKRNLLRLYTRYIIDPAVTSLLRQVDEKGQRRYLPNRLQWR